MTTEIRPERLGYVSLKVRSLERSVEFFTRAVHLEVSEFRNGKVFLRGGQQHHWMVLEESDEPGLGRVGIEVSTVEELNILEERLKTYGVDVETGDGLENDRISQYVRFNDPSGNPIELYADMITMPTAPHPRRVELLEIQHVVLNVIDPIESAHFYTQLLGMRVSDWVERRLAFMHFRNGWHHGIGVGKSDREDSGLSHICFQPPDLDSVMSARALVQKLKLPITRDLVRHGPSNSIGFYFGGEDAVVEFSYGARYYAPDLDFRPRVMPLTKETADVWQATTLGEVDAEEIKLVETLREEARLLPQSAR